MTPAERQQLKRDRRKAGLVLVQEWVPADKVDAAMVAINNIITPATISDETLAAISKGVLNRMTRAARAIRQMEAALSDAQAVFTPIMRRAIDEMIATLFEASNRQTVVNAAHAHALDLVETAKREKLPSLERVAKFADTASATDWALIYLFLRDNYREAIASEQRPERVAFDQFLAGIAVAAGTRYSKTGDISPVLETIDRHGITPVATAMFLHLAETIRANKAVRLTTDPDNYGLQIVQVADAILDRLPKGSV